MKKLLQMKFMLLLCALIVGSGTMWAEEETIASGTFNGKDGVYTTGWTTTGTGVGRTDCVIIGADENITSPALNLSQYSKVTISIKGRRYGSLSGSKATIDASIGVTSMGTTDANGTNATTSLTDIVFTPTSSMTSVQLVFTCTNATSAGSSHGAGINTITITGTKSGGGDDKPAAPTFDPVAGTYTSAQNVAISTTTEDAVIYYTTDGTDPTTGSSVYSSPITVTATTATIATTTIKAIAVKDNVSSALATATYTIDLTPTIVFDGQQNPYNVPYTADDTNIHYVASNITGTVSLVICDANGGAATYDWFSAELYGDSYVKVEWDANGNTQNRTAYFKLTSGNTTSDIFAVTQGGVDYATLPFEFDGGRSNIASTTGLTQNGLDSDYSSSPKLKFNDTGDWMILKINEAPGTLTFDIKGNTFSGGTFTVQTSADGVTYTDIKTYTTTTIDNNNIQNEEINNLASDVRYIKWIYTSKSSGNVALGNIKLAKPSTEPVITVADPTINVAANEQDFTRNLTYENITITGTNYFGIQYYNANNEEVDEPEWIVAEVEGQGSDYVLSCFVEENTGDERTAYLKVFATAGEEDVYSNLVTITQAKPVETVTYTLAQSITPGKHYIIASGTDGKVYVMGGQKSTNREAVEVEITTENVISVTDEKICEFIVSKDGEYYTFFDENLNGYLNATGAGGTSNNHLKTLGVNDNKGQWSISIDDGGVATVIANAIGRNTMRFNNGSSKLFSCYSSGQQNIYLFEKNDDERNLVIPIAAACTDGKDTPKYYGTFSSSSAFVVPENLTVSEIGINNDGTMNVQNYASGAIVPANTGVMVSATAGDRSYVVNVSNENEGTPIPDFTNALRPTGDDGISIADMEGKDSSCKFYRLTMHNGEKIGFWWGYENGGAFAVAANKAYMVVANSLAGAREGFAFDDDSTTGISNVNVNENVNGSVFDLQGRKVSTPGKGLYIVNGKKVVIK